MERKCTSERVKLQRFMATDDAWRARLLTAIENSDLSDRQIGIRAGVGQSWVSDFKNGKKPPKLETFLKVCETLGVSPVYILAGVPITPRVERIVSEIVRLDPNQQELLVGLIRSIR